MDTFLFNRAAMVALLKFRKLIDHHWKIDQELWKKEVSHLCNLFRIYLGKAKLLATNDRDRESIYNLSKAMGVTY